MAEAKAEVSPNSEVSAPAAVDAFDDFDVPSRCRELLQRLPRLPSQPGPSSWSWDILELFQESLSQLDAFRLAHSNQAGGGFRAGHWQEIREAVAVDEKKSGMLPLSLRRQCEELLGKREAWLDDFSAELTALRGHATEVRDRLLFEDPAESKGWFGTSGVSPQEVQRLIERHLDMHQRGMRLACQLKLLCRSLRQQGAVSNRRAFQARTVSDKLHAALLSMATVAVTPVPGSFEVWMATTTMMFVEKDQAWQHVVYEHPRNADTTDAILTQFESFLSQRARSSLTAWSSMPAGDQMQYALVHNASVRRVVVEARLVNLIDGSGTNRSAWSEALAAHPMGNVMKSGFKRLGGGEGENEDAKVTVGPQRFGMVPLPAKPDTNWAWQGVFSYGDTKVGECWLREGGIFSFICVDCGLRVGERGESDQGTREASALLDTGEIEVMNGTDEIATVKVFTAQSNSNAATRLFRRAVAEGSVDPGASIIFEFASDERVLAGETDYDLEIRIGAKKTQCEVLGGQVVFIDGVMMD